MERCYAEAQSRILENIKDKGCWLDCGSGSGHLFRKMKSEGDIDVINYFGIERMENSVSLANRYGLHVILGDLNTGLPFRDDKFDCIAALSVLEHLTHGCRFLSEAFRVLKPGGHLVLITPNLSAWFNIFLLLIGKMPSSGPHPDSAALVRWGTPVKFRDIQLPDLSETTTSDRHLVVFTYKTLKYYLNTLGFRNIESKTYGMYPFPKSFQPFLEKIDPWHCHQMLFDCTK